MADLSGPNPAPAAAPAQTTYSPIDYENHGINAQVKNYYDLYGQYSNNRSDANRDLLSQQMNMITNPETRSNLLRNTEFGEAKYIDEDFRKNRRNYEYSQYQPLVDQGMYGLNQTDDAIRHQYNRRGLLNSPGMAGSMVSARTQIASHLSQMKQEINQEASHLQQGYDSAVANIGLGSFQDSISLASRGWEQALNDSVQRRADMAQLGSAVGTGAGYYLGQRAGNNASSSNYGYPSNYVSQNINPGPTSGYLAPGMNYFDSVPSARGY